MKKFQVLAEVTVHCERIIEADCLEDAEETANGMNADEWMDYVQSEYVEITDVEPYSKPKKRKSS